MEENVDLYSRLISNLATIESAAEFAVHPSKLREASSDLNTVVERTLISAGFHLTVPELLARLCRFLDPEHDKFSLQKEEIKTYTHVTEGLQQHEEAFKAALVNYLEDKDLHFPNHEFSIGEYLVEVLNDIATESEKIHACNIVMQKKQSVNQGN